jgi:type IV pilus assembly protein PilM
MKFSHVIQKLFPAPSFVRMPALSVDISDDVIRFATLNRRNGILALGQSGEHTLPKDVIVSGVVRDVPGFVSALKTIQQKTKATWVRFSLPEEHAYVFSIVLPKAALPHLEEAIRLQIEDQVPLPESEISFGYEIFREHEDSLLIGVTAFPKEIVETYTHAFLSAGFRPLVGELEVHALSRVVVPRHDSGTYILVDYGKNRSGFSIIVSGVIVFTSTLDIGSDSLTESIAKYFKISQEEAETIKQSRGLLNNTDDQDYFFTVINNISALRDEINKHYLYWHTAHGKLPGVSGTINGMYLVGGGSLLPGFAEYLSSTMHMPVTVASVWKNILSFDDMIPELSQEESLSYATALGLALGEIYDY